MLELRNWYRERLSTRIAALEEARKGLRRKSTESADSLRRIAHSLRGSGATYGFPEITEAARELEEASEQELGARAETLIVTLREAAAGGKGTRTGILVVEDDEEQSKFACEALGGPGFDLYEARTAAQAQAILEEKEVSLILLDLILPDSDGRNFLVKLRDRLATAAIPVVVLTVKNASQVRAECLALGADDFLEKPVPREKLKALVHDRLQKGSEIARELRRDPLTGLPNRAAFHEMFQRLRYGISPSPDVLSLGLLDLDNFASINDDYGPAMADQILRRAAALISRALRTTDFVARWSGSEFVVLFPKTEAVGAATALEKAQKVIRKESLPTGEGTSVQVSFSAGVAQVNEGARVEEVVAEADRYLYQAKSSGSERIVAAGDQVAVPRKRILVAEDDELIRLVVKRLLEREGYEVLPTVDGRAALEAAQADSCSMVVSDVRMPRMDGFELLTRLRQLPAYARVPIVMLTAMGSEEDVVRGYELGADDYIVKPFSSAELMARIRRLLKRY
jgi:diguanylate cyclase (GGDEF)-like protein